MIIVFVKNEDGEELEIFDTQKVGEELSGSWSLQLNHMNGEQQQIDIDMLTDLISMDQTKNFAGKVIYEKTVQVSGNQHQYIDLGDVQGISELTLNGELVGTKWYGAHVYPIKDILKEGENKISIKLTTVTGNYLKGLTNNKVVQNWTKRQEYYPMGIMGPVRIV